MSGNVQVMEENKTITGKRAATITIAQGTDPEFFGMDKNGNEIGGL